MRSLRSPHQRRLQEVLVALRKQGGLTQEQVAQRLGRPQSFVAKVEHGERRLDVVEFIEYTEALGMSPSVVIDDIVKAYR